MSGFFICGDGGNRTPVQTMLLIESTMYRIFLWFQIAYIKNILNYTLSILYGVSLCRDIQSNEPAFVYHSQLALRACRARMLLRLKRKQERRRQHQSMVIRQPWLLQRGCFLQLGWCSKVYEISSILDIALTRGNHLSRPIIPLKYFRTYVLFSKFTYVRTFLTQVLNLTHHIS